MTVTSVIDDCHNKWCIQDMPTGHHIMRYNDPISYHCPSWYIWGLLHAKMLPLWYWISHCWNNVCRIAFTPVMPFIGMTFGVEKCTRVMRKKSNVKQHVEFECIIFVWCRKAPHMFHANRWIIIHNKRCLQNADNALWKNDTSKAIYIFTQLDTNYLS